MIHIVYPTAAAIQKWGLDTVGIFGTAPTMRMEYLKDCHADRFGIRALAPTLPEQEEIDHIIFYELVKGIISPASKPRVLGNHRPHARRGRHSGVDSRVYQKKKPFC
uniref:Uncharacterized protein n=1 Tax=Amphora coffeiformis TaxID=265554 RepID=A0A7S3L4C3_9STRA|eukprot:scaffold12825_cov164-Amphora_coffeaeformis.AAC.3